MALSLKTQAPCFLVYNFWSCYQRILGARYPPYSLLQCHILLAECLCGVLASHPSSQMPFSFLLRRLFLQTAPPSALYNTMPHNLLWKALLDISSSVVFKFQSTVKMPTLFSVISLFPNCVSAHPLVIADFIIQWVCLSQDLWLLELQGKHTTHIPFPGFRKWW